MFDISAISTASAKPFIDEVVKPAGGWQAISTITGWSTDGYDTNAAMKKVHIDFWLSSLFSVTVSPDWVDQKKNVLEVKDKVSYLIPINFLLRLFVCLCLSISVCAVADINTGKTSA